MSELVIHRIALEKLMPAIIFGSASSNTATVDRPSFFTTAQTYSPSFSNSLASIPFFLQKPSAALQGVTPSSSNARESGGPRTRSSTLG